MQARRPSSRSFASLAAPLLASFCVAASAQSIDLSGFEHEMAGPRTQVMVLGSTHLSGMPDSFKAEQLEPLLERLMRYEPDIITIEALSGETCDQLQRYAAIYPDVAKEYCWDAEAGKKATGLDVPAALAEVEKTLATWPGDPTPAQRRRLIALLAAANDRASMVVQWLQLPATERRAGDTLDAALVAQVEKSTQSKNENTMIAATLAARLGLQRVHAIDDHTADAVSVKAGPALGKIMQAIWSQSANAPIMAESTALENTGDMLAMYRFYNSPDAQRDFTGLDFGAALKEKSPERYGRQYVAWWEVRNLRMVANIRAAFANRPGARVLSIVGSSHKPYFDRYLGMMHEVRIVDTEAWLK